ncbi:MAG TPA: ATP-binding protein [Thermoanaerobaculia bacterium]|nr:ATP-binding protein [Thermoanaerobaculia bacterium]
MRSSLDGILAFDRECRYTVWNPAMERLTGLASEAVLGRSAFDLFPFLSETGEDRHFHAALDGRDTVAHDRPYRVPETGRQGYFEGHYSPLRDAAGAVVGGLAIIRDVTERRQADENRDRLAREQTARARAEAVGERLSLLSEISRELSATLDDREAFRALAQLTVPSFADYCVVDVFDETGEIRREAAIHRDPAQAGRMAELRRHPPRVGARAGMGLVLRTGEPVLISVITEDQIRPAAQDERHLEALLALAPRSGIIVPIMAHGTIFGAISFSIVDEERRYGPVELSFAEELARRAALAVDNARLYREAQRALQELAAADRRKDEFLAMLAHELRNPLGAIANAGHVLDLRRSEDPETRDLLAVIGRQIRHLSRLVDDLLDVSRVTRGQIELRPALVEIHSLVQGAVETVRPMVDQRHHDFFVHVPADPLWLEADATRIEQVLTNLLNNAVKFTDPGGRVELRVESHGEEAVVTVSDNGPGISPDLLPRIFDLFVQEERSLARSHGGLGIGLTLVRSLVERHGGRVEAASDGPGHGSRFTLRLPLRAAPAAVASSSPAGLDEVGDNGRRILLVEDNPDAAESLGELLRIWGHEVRIAYEGLGALDQARVETPDIVLLDIGLPGMDGYEVARALRSQPGLERTRLIALTGYGQDADRHRSSQAGFDHHFVKPVDIQALRLLLASEPVFP